MDLIVLEGDTAESEIESEDHLKSSKEVDYSEYFSSDKIFCSVNEFKEWAKSIAQEHGMFLIVQTSRKHKVYLSCECYGKPRMKNNIDVARPKFTGTKKCRCPFMLVAHEFTEGKWRMSILSGKHNHPPATYHHGHRLVSRLSKDQCATIASSTKSHVKLKKILDHLRREYPGIKTTLRHIYNARKKIKLADMGGKTVVQQLMCCIQENDYAHWYRADPTTKHITDIMFAHSESIRLLRLFPYVLLIDSTYKTNKYKMPLVEIIGVTPVGKNFNVAISFIRNESEEHYSWVLQNLANLFNNDTSPHAIVTDRELGLMKAIQYVFPHSYHLLCTFHINKNVLMHATKFMSNNKKLGIAFSQGKWKKMVNSLSGEGRSTSPSTLLGRGRGRGRGRESCPLKKQRPDIFKSIPPCMRSEIVSWVDVRGDGNCGFRCVAQVVMNDQERWMDVRRDLHDELSNRFDIYKEIFGEEYTKSIMESCCHFSNTPAPPERWMSLFALGLVIATRYNAMVLEVSKAQNITYLPLIFPDGVSHLSREIVIFYHAAAVHFILLHTTVQFPLPCYDALGNRHRNEDVTQFANIFEERRKRWDLESTAKK